MLKVILNIGKFLAITSSRVAIILLAFVSSILLLQVILRYIFNAALPWPEEAARYSMIWVVMLISNSLIRDEELITVDFFDKLWPAKILVYRNTAYRLMLLVLLAILFKEGIIQAIAARGHTTTAIGISWFWPYLSIPIGAGLMFIQMVILIICNFIPHKEKRRPQ